jgi:malate dehydrogenase (oxaloacetate-decarboxylating)
MSESSSSLTLRTTVPATVGTFGRVTAAISDAGGRLGGVDIVRSTKTDVTRDYTVYVPSDEVGAAVVAAVEAVEGVRVEEVRNRVLTLHEGGVVGMRNRMPLTSRDDLSMAYTPGVARVCMAIHHDFEQAWEYTIKANSVMVVSDGSSVVGLGDLGADASLPACEAKCLFLRELAGIDAFPLPVDARDPEAIIEAVALCSSVFAGIHLSDISAPRCFQIQTGLAARLDIPVFHDDQQGTAVAVLAALRNGLAVTGVAPDQARVVVAGEGPGGVATAALLRAAGVGVASATTSPTRWSPSTASASAPRTCPRVPSSSRSARRSRRSPPWPGCTGTRCRARRTRSTRRSPSPASGGGRWPAGRRRSPTPCCSPPRAPSPTPRATRRAPSAPTSWCPRPCRAIS